MSTTSRKAKIAPEFTRARAFIAEYSCLPTDDDYDIVALWSLGTHTFSPAAPAMPQAFPYLYLTGAKGSGKTHLGVHVLKWITRNHESIVDVTGATLFRLLGDYDAESGEVIPHYPTLAIDEIDAKYASGASSDEQLRGVANAGYQQGSTVPRSAGKTSIRFPVYCPKIFIGIDNGRLPDTLVDRSIRIDIRKGTPEQLDRLTEGPYAFEVKDYADALRQDMAEWAKANAMIYRDYRPARPEGIHARKWEIARPLIQLARAAGIEQRITDALVRVMSRNPAKVSGREAMYRSIARLLAEHPRIKQFLTREIVAWLDSDGVQLPGRGGGKGLSAALLRDGSGEASYIRLKGEGKPEADWDPRVIVNPMTGKPRFIARGYSRTQLEEAMGTFADEELD